MKPGVEPSIVPRWGERAAIALAVGLLAFALHRYLGGFESHVRYVRWIADEFASEQLAVIRASPISEHLHRLGGSALVIAGLLQFSPGLRRRRPALHRAIGRVYVALALVAASSGITMAIAHPFGGLAETIPGVLFGVLLIVTTIVALRLAMRRRIAAHRAWMIRSFALVLGPMTIRLVYVPMWMLGGIPERETIAPAFWIGWLVNLGLAELWIRRSRRRPPAR